MKTTRVPVRALAGALTLLAAACATAPEPPPGPSLTYEPTLPCAPHVSVATATSLTPEDPTGRYDVITPVNASSSCLVGPVGTAEGYVAYAMPMSGKPVSISAGAIVEPGRMLAPRVFTLTADGQVARTFPRAEMMARGNALAVLFRPRPDERYVVVSADAAAVAGAAGAGETPLSPYSYEGKAFARVYFEDPAK
ncbi:MAG: hypothetical protein R3C52_15560 [Hyphomonadaceae bacterium]